MIATARLIHYPAAYCFDELAIDALDQANPRALAIVRDDEVWSQLIEVGSESPDHFGVVRFEFPADVDNSGFVGWLASRLKAEIGTGVFVICGYNNRKGGIFDYWGFPIEVRLDVLEVIAELRGLGSSRV